MIAAAGGTGERPDALNMAQFDPEQSTPMSASSSMMGSTVFGSTSTLVPDRISTATENSSSVTQKKVERMHSHRSRREHGRHHSHSRRHYNEELKTVGEYALHVLFTSVSVSSECSGACC
jgi:hypothetical protein